MPLIQPIKQVFEKLTETLNQLSDTEYTKPCPALLNATIGQHVRHIAEMFLCLEKGYNEGVVNYEQRKRDHYIESNREHAAGLLKQIYTQLDKPNKDITLEMEDHADSSITVSIPSNYFRELAYSLEHTIHHMALIRIGINDVASVSLPEEFGVAFSTLKYRQQCAQ
jgi:uncharacterized damage-inducible protein DinB